MSCIHIISSVKISKLDIDIVKRNGQHGQLMPLLCGQKNYFDLDSPHMIHSYWKNGHRIRHTHPDLGSDFGNWNCVECGTTLSPWLCLYCGLIHCGRYVNQDGLKHYRLCREHNICMDCHNYSVFCYSCDEFVGNDTVDKKLESVRESLRYFNHFRFSDHNYFTPRFFNPVGVVSVESEIKRVPQINQSTQYCIDEKRNNKTIEQRPINVFVERSELEIEEKSPVKKRKIKIKNGKVTKKPIRIKPKKELKVPKSVKTLRGLRNLGNTCFMNAVLQSLNNIDEFCYYFMKLPEIAPPKNGGHPRYNMRKSTGPCDAFLTEELRKTVVALSEQNDTTAIAPDALFSVVWKLVPRFRGFQQQDAHEFLRCVLDRLSCELRSVRPADEQKSMVTAIFEGNLQSQVACLMCEALSRKQDPFLDLSLDIPSAQNGATKNSSGIIRLTDCLRRFFAKEELDNAEQYFCEKCCKKSPSTKQFFIRRLPNVLCLHLKRFRWTRHDRRKVEGFVEFPLRGLDLQQFLLESVPKTRRVSPESSGFDLAAVVVHHGSGASSGHYTAFARHKGAWYHFNDSSVSACPEHLVAKQKAYILFYVRRKLDKLFDGKTKN